MGHSYVRANVCAVIFLRSVFLIFVSVNEALPHVIGPTLVTSSLSVSFASPLLPPGDGFSPEGSAPPPANPAFSKWGGTRSEVQRMLAEAEHEKLETKKSCDAFEQTRMDAIAATRDRIEVLNGRVERYKWSAKSDADLVEIKLKYAKDELWHRNARCKGEARLLTSELSEVSRHEFTVSRLLASSRCDGDIGRKIHGCDAVSQNMAVLAAGIVEKKQVLEAQQAKLNSVCDDAHSQLEDLIASLAGELRGRQKQLLARKEADGKTKELHRLFADYVDTTDRCEQALEEHDAEIGRLRTAISALDELGRQREAGESN